MRNIFYHVLSCVIYVLSCFICWFVLSVNLCFNTKLSECYDLQWRKSMHVYLNNYDKIGLNFKKFMELPISGAEGRGFLLLVVLKNPKVIMTKFKQWLGQLSVARFYKANVWIFYLKYFSFFKVLPSEGMDSGSLTAPPPPPLS